MAKISSAPSDSVTGDRSWTKKAMEKLWNERRAMAHTPIIKFVYPSRPKVEIIFKDESASRSGSLKHRYALMLMMWALREGKINEGITVYEASSGNTANSFAYMCRLIGVNFTAIVPENLDEEKEKEIERNGGNVIRTPFSERMKKAKKLAKETDGFFMNQFGNGDHAEEFHDSGDSKNESANLFHELMVQLGGEVPDYFVHTAGTGGTISSVGRFVRKYNLPTKVVLADTEFSIYYDFVVNKTFTEESGAEFWVEPGISGVGFGLQGVATFGETTCLDRAVIDRAIKIPDLASVAAMHVLNKRGICGGPSTGLNFLAALRIAATEGASGKKTIISTLLCDSGENYKTTYYNRDWISKEFEAHGGIEIFDAWVQIIERSLQEAIDPLEEGKYICRNK